MGAFSSCADFDPDFLLLAALEAQTAQALRCAQQAYTLLYSTTSGCDAETAQPGHMAHLLRHLIKVTQTKWDAADAASVANKVQFERGRADELAQQLLVSSERLSALGVVAFAGSDATTAAKELAWFAMTAWNAGLATTALQEGATPAWLAAHQLFGAAGAFMDAQAQMDPAGEHAPSVIPHRRQLAWLLSAASALEVHKEGARAKNDSAAERPAQLLAEAASALQRAAAVECASGDATRAQVFMMLTGFGIKAASGDANGCLDMLRSAEALPGLTSDTGLKLAKMAAEDAGPAVALRAFELCLRVMQRGSSGAAPNYGDLAYVLRSTLTYGELVGGSGGADSRDARLIRGFREAAALLASVPAGAYPPMEAEWLMTQAWNRGAMLIKLGRPEPGEALLKVGLDLQRHATKHSPQAEAHKAEMLATLAALSRKRGAPAPAPVDDGMVA